MPTGPPPTDVFVQGLAAPASPSQQQPLDLVERSSEATEYDDDVMRRQTSPQHCLQGGASVVDEEGEEGELAKAGGEEDDEGNEGDVDGEDDNMNNDGNVGGDEVEENRFSHCERRRKDHNAGRSGMTTTPSTLVMHAPSVVNLQPLMGCYKNNNIVCDESAKENAYLTKFIEILVKDNRFDCRFEKPRSTYRNNRDMYHNLGPKRLKLWEYLFHDAPQGCLDGNYIYKKAKATETLKHYHGALTGAFEIFVARCKILKFNLYKDQLTFKDCAELAKWGEGFNPVDSDEDSSDSDLDIENDTDATGRPEQGVAMDHDVHDPGRLMTQAHDDGTARSQGCSNLPLANSVTSMVGRVECTPMDAETGMCRGDEEDELDIPDQALKLAPGEPIPPDLCREPGAKRGRHQSEGETFVQCPARPWQLEFSRKFYNLPTSPSRGSMDRKVDHTVEAMEVNVSPNVMLLSALATGDTKAEQREDDRITSSLKVALIPDVEITCAAKKSTTQISEHVHMSIIEPSDVGATYESLLLTGAPLEGRSEMESESPVGMSIAGLSLQPSSCTDKGDAFSSLTPQRGGDGDGGKGRDAEELHYSRNLDTLTSSIDDEVGGEKDLIDTARGKHDG
ncbi:hypothetical protein CBR_g47134 [Chara braunii]|uniref:Uncharacterized protein n=1 Tax=Chara braunii TaxID=69332 RepID=A0A388M1Q3_CHABU|nr:hypothetical protein CBR_g47134 [Chara braunii]|eukprot:GBG88435.1 hypothetical protein CBR_g47134 [Chara braunii]